MDPVIKGGEAGGHSLRGDEPWPSFPIQPGLELMPREFRDEYYALRRDAIKREEDDPLRYGYEPPSWERADKALKEFREANPTGVLIHLVLGGHRAGKTEWKSKRLVQNLFTRKGYKAWAAHATQESSREAQQSKIYKYLPPEYRAQSGRLREGMKAKVNYAPWSGFTEDVLAVPDSFGGTSECRFKFYSMNPRSLEGAEIDEAWLDEECPLEWLDAVIFRLVSRNGTLFMTFTPRWGYTSTVKAVLGGAVTLREGECDSDLLAVRNEAGEVIAARRVPILQENMSVGVPGHRAKAVIVYFHTAENPFPLGNWETMKETLRGASEDKILTVAYGVPTKSMMGAFPAFKDSVHIVSVNRFNEILKGGGVWYHFLDPCSGRNWFQVWIFVDCLNRAFVAGESPSFGHQGAYIPGIGDPGPWAVPGAKADGEMGEGQKEWGWGFLRYLEEIDRMERLLAESGSASYGAVGSNPTSATKITVSARWIDARYGNARKTSEERSVTTIEQLSDLGMDFLAAPSEKYIDSGREGGTGSLRMINDRLFYDEKREIDITNTPRLFVVESCPNTIWALKEWTGRDGTHGASKDPIDCLRMFVLSGSEYVDEAMLTPKTPWMQQFSR